MNKTKRIIGVFAIFALTPLVGAIPITGHIAFDGSTSLDAPIPGATAFLSFTNAKVSVGTQAGTYLGTAGTSVMMEALQFSPFVLPAAPLWSFTSGAVDYSFELTSLSAVTVTDLGGGLYSLNVAGKGMAAVTGYDDTAGAFSITTTGNASATDLGFGAFTFTAEQVPDAGSTLAILGLGLFGLMVLRRSREFAA